MFEAPIIQSWQNSGQLARYFWSRLKFTPFVNSAVCVSMHAGVDGYTVELSLEVKNEDSKSKGEYNKALLENIGGWIEKYNVDLDLFYIGAKTKRHSLKEYFESS